MLQKEKEKQADNWLFSFSLYNYNNTTSFLAGGNACKGIGNIHLPPFPNTSRGELPSEFAIKVINKTKFTYTF